MNTRIAINAVVLVAFIVAVLPLRAGPPLICHPIKVKEGQSLPWNEKDSSKERSYNAANVVQDTLDLLKSDTPVLVRMETLRRATLYIDRDQSRANSLLGNLMTRAMDSEARGKPNALAYFDAGYLAGCYHQTGTKTDFGPEITKGEGASSIAGYAWIAKAISIDPKSTDMEFGAALITADRRVPEHEAHLKRILAAGVPSDSSAKSVLEWLAQINGTTLDGLRAKYKLTDARASQ